MGDLITDEIVEAAGRAQYEGRMIELDQDGDTDWDTLPEPWREEWREHARAALEAAAPLIAGRALREEADEMERYGRETYWRDDSPFHAQGRFHAEQHALRTREHADRIEARS